MKRFIIAAVLIALIATDTLLSAETKDVLTQIEWMVSVGEKAGISLVESIAEGIENDPAYVSQALVQRLNDKNLTEQQIAVYVWALGLARDKAAVAQIEAVHGKSKSDLVRGNCLRSLAMIGGHKAETFLLSSLDTTTDKDRRFDILNLLGQMQCEAALPKAEEILKLDIKEFYWQPIFVFGKMGDKAVPFLLKKINDKDRNTRANSICLLGQWLIVPEAAIPLQDQFWVEKDAELRIMILGSLERTIPDLTQMKVFFEQVAEKDKQVTVAKFARETLDNMNQMKSKTENFAQRKQPSAVSFQGEYEQLFKSAGKKGSYVKLGISSTSEDEPKLKALRERILQRDSDEAFYDYHKVNEIIIQNRMLKATISKTIQPTSAGDSQHTQLELKKPEK